jgi:hypothetical protein
MTRWYWKRWAWAVLVGATAAAGLTPAGPGAPDGPPALPKVGDVFSLKFKDGPDRQVKVLKTEKQPDGSYLSEVKDTKTGETFTLMDRPDDTPPPGGKAEPAKDAAKAKAAPAANAMPADPAKDRKPTAPAAKPTPEPEPEKPGLLKRLFGRKPATPPAPASTTTAKPAAPAAPPAPAQPPAVRPTPAPIAPPVVGGTGEPPRVMPARPAAPPATTPTPLPLPPVPGGLPPIPVAPNGVSAAVPGVVTAGRVVAAPAAPVDMAVAREIQPFVDALATEASPGLRLQAVRSLAGCRHASTGAVKAALARAAAGDDHPAVRACCVRELCKLGYHDPAFLTHLTHACADPDPGVRAAAKDALAKLTRPE